MNERIKQLAVQAGYIEAHYASDHGPFVPAEFNKEKFAELIIKECATVANRAENAEAETQCMYDVITEHFGVEE